MPVVHSPRHRFARLALAALLGVALAAAPALARPKKGGRAASTSKKRRGKAAVPAPAATAPAAPASTPAPAEPVEPDPEPAEVASPATSSGPPARAKVAALAVDRVFLSVGAAAGVKRGALVTVRGFRGQVKASIDVVSSHAASFGLADAPSRVRVGDVVVIRAERAAAESDAGNAVVVGPRTPQKDLYDRNLAAPAPAPPLVVAAVDKEARAAQRAEARPAKGAAWHGELGLSGIVVHDGSNTGLDYYQARLDSRLTGTDLAGGHLLYDHRVALQGEFGPGLDQRAGFVRRYVRADWLNLTYLPVAAGDYRITAGRLLPSALGLNGPVDGARLAWNGKHAGIGLTAGLAPDPLNQTPSTRSTKAGVDVHVNAAPGGVELRA